jgi:hypothetical protein
MDAAALAAALPFTSRTCPATPPTRGAYLHLAADGIRLNPFDLTAPAPAGRPCRSHKEGRQAVRGTTYSLLLAGPAPGTGGAAHRSLSPPIRPPYVRNDCDTAAVGGRS